MNTKTQTTKEDLKQLTAQGLLNRIDQLVKQMEQQQAETLKTIAEACSSTATLNSQLSPLNS